MSDTRTTRRNVIQTLVWYWLPPLVWMGMIFYLSDQPDLPGAPKAWLDTLLKKGAHFGVYALLAFWWWRALKSIQGVSQPGRTDKIVLLLAFLISVLYGVSDEFHQSFVPGRQPSPLDVLVDAAGAAAALWVVWRRRVGS